MVASISKSYLTLFGSIHHLYVSTLVIRRHIKIATEFTTKDLQLLLKGWSNQRTFACYLNSIFVLPQSESKVLPPLEEYNSSIMAI